MIPRSILTRRMKISSSGQDLTRIAYQASSYASPRSLARTTSTTRAFTSTPATSLLATQVKRAVTIQTPLPSISSTVARLLPKRIPDQELPLPRQTCETIIAKVLQQVRSAADAKTVEEAKNGWAKLDEQLRQDLTSEGYPANSLTELTSILIASSGDPRRHPIAFNMYRIAFGSDPAELPTLEPDSGINLAQPASTPVGSDDVVSSKAHWGDWQSSYHWANLVLQGRAPPPPGTYLLVAGEQRAAQASQASAAYRVFAHLAERGHPQGIFGIGRHLLSTLERGVDPTALGAMPRSVLAQPRTRQETIEEVEKLYRRAAEAGVEEAWFELAALHMEGKWVRKDDEKARSLLREGVVRGSSRACRALAHLMTKEAQAPRAPSSLATNGARVDASKRDELLAESLRLLERGAELGSVDCAFSAGMRYLLQPPLPSEEDGEAGASFDTSLDTALESSGSSPALWEKAKPLNLALQVREEHIVKWGVEPSDDVAAKWFAEAAEGGHALSMMNLARMYLESRVVPGPRMAATAQASVGESGSDSQFPSIRERQLVHAAELYAKVLAKAMGPEGQRNKAMAEVQAKMGAGGAAVLEAGQGLDELGARAEEGLKLVNEEVAMLKGQ